MHHRFGFTLSFALLRTETLFAHCALENPLHDPVFRNVPKGVAEDLSLHRSALLSRVIVGAGAFFACLCLALDGFVVGGMILLFLPPVAHVAAEPYFAAAGIVRNRNVVLGLPVKARLNKRILTIGS